MSLLHCCGSRDFIWGTHPQSLRPVGIRLDPLSHTSAKPNKKIEQATPPVIGLSQEIWQASQTSLNDSQLASGPDCPVDDGFDSDEERKKCSRIFQGTLKSMKVQFLQRVRHSARIPCHLPASDRSIEEAVARRAELKRLMHKRIQEELHTEQANVKKGYKPTASVSLTPSVDRFPVLNSGPRDYIEFAVATPSAVDSHTNIKHMPEPEQFILDGEPHKTTQSDANHHGYAPSYGGSDQSIYEVTGTVRCLRPSIVAMGPAPVSIHGSLPQASSKKSFQFSNSTSRLGRILGPNNGFSSRRASSSADGRSALGIWLIAQGLRSADSSTLPQEDDESSNAMIEASAENKFRSIDGVPEVCALKPHRHDKYETTVDCSKPSRGLDSSVSLSQTSAAKDWTRISIPDSSPISFLQSQDVKCPNKENNLEIDKIDVVADLATDNTSSSNYPSKLPSFQHSPEISRLNLNTLNIQDLQGLEMSPFDWPGSSLSICEIQSLGERGTDKITKSNHSITPVFYDNIENHGNDTCDSSLSHLETGSFLMREAELETIHKRFGEVLTRKKRPFPLKSRFREELSGSDPKRTRKMAILRKMALTVPRRLKPRSETLNESEGQISTLNRISDPNLQNRGTKREKDIKSPFNIPACLSMNLARPRTYPRPYEREDTKSLWQHGAKSELKNKCSSNIGLGTLGLFQKTGSNIKRSQNADAKLWDGKKAQNDTLSVDRVRGQKSRLTPEGDEMRADERIQCQNSCLVPEICLEGVINIGTQQSIRLKKPPRAWSRYPSHTREERTKYASIRDNVNSRDFAVKKIDSDGNVTWATDTNVLARDIRDERLDRSLSVRCREAVKSKLTRFISPTRAEIETTEYSRLHQVVSRGTNPLEYPELKILPTNSGFKEFQALEKEIDQLKSQGLYFVTENNLTRPRSIHSSGDKISASVRQSAISDHDEFVSKVAVPATPHLSGSCSVSLTQETEALTDTFVTPKSHLSLSIESQNGDKTSDAGSIKSDKLTVSYILEHGDIATTQS